MRVLIYWANGFKFKARLGDWEIYAIPKKEDDLK